MSNGTPFGEDTRREARELIARYPKPRSALLPLLHLVQSVEGYVSPQGIGIYAALKEHLGVEGQDAVSDDGKVSLEHIECNAACDYAPVVMVNWEFFDN